MAVDENPGSPQDTTRPRDVNQPESAGHSNKTKHSEPLKARRKKRRRLLGWVFSLASIVIFTWIAVALISGRGPGLSELTTWLKIGVSSEPASQYQFSVGSNRVFAELGGSLAAAGTLGIQVQNASGTETLRDLFHMSTPAVDTAEDRAIAFDIGGTSIRTFTKTQVTASIETVGVIISASINKNNWFVVCT